MGESTKKIPISGIFKVVHIYFLENPDGIATNLHRLSDVAGVKQFD